MQSRITNKMALLPDKPFRRIKWNWCVDGFVNFEEPFGGLEELSFNLVSCITKTKYVYIISARSKLPSSAVAVKEQSFI